MKIAKVREDDKIPHALKELAEHPGVGRKTANVIIRESADKAEGIVGDLHVVRVAPRIGVASGSNADKIEKQLYGVSRRNMECNRYGHIISRT